MANIISVRGYTPEIDPSCWLADDADIIGRVHIGQDCSIWFKTVIRGDVCKISIGEKCNIQDGAIIHGTYNKSETILKDRVSVGHGAILHGCHIDSDVLVGMRSVIMDNAHVESNVIVAAGARSPRKSSPQVGIHLRGYARKNPQGDRSRKNPVSHHQNCRCLHDVFRVV